MGISYAQEIMTEVQDLEPERQREVLQYIRALKRPKGMSGKEFVAHIRAIRFPSDDLAQIAEAIKDLNVIEPEEDINLDG